MIETGLKDKVVIVTGAAAGIGRATADSFVPEGCRGAAWDGNQAPERPGVVQTGGRRGAGVARRHGRTARARGRLAAPGLESQVLLPRCYRVGCDPGRGRVGGDHLASMARHALFERADRGYEALRPRACSLLITASSSRL